ncbi:MAG: polysaccharide biosynthesis tyrosine autokinase [Cyclobacteriaceae bacterium]
MKSVKNNNEILYMEEKNQSDPIKFIRKVLNYWPFILVFMIFTMGLAYYYNQSTPPVYQVGGKFMITDNRSANLIDLTGMPQGSGYQPPGQAISNQAILMKSKPVAEKVLEIMDLSVDYFEPGMLVDKELYKNSPIFVQVDWNHPQILGDKIKISWTDQESFTIDFPGESYYKFLPGLPSEIIDLENFKSRKFKFGEWIDFPLAKIQVGLIENAPEGEILIQLNTKNSLLGRYAGENLQVWPIDQSSSILGLSLNTSHPVKGAEYLNNLMEVYMGMELEEKNRVSKNTVDFIDKQISGVADSLNYFESSLESYRSKNKTYNVEVEGSSVYKEITELERQLAQEKWKRQYFMNLQTYLVRESYNQIIIPSGIGIEDPVLNGLIQNLITLQRERSDYLNTLTEASPLVREVTRKIDDTNASLLEALRNTHNNTQNLIADLENRIQTAENQFTRLPSTQQDLIKIERGFTLNESIYTFLLQRRAESALAMASNTSSSRIVEFSQPSDKPIKVKEIAVYIVALFVGFAFPVAFFSTIVFLDKRIKGPVELEEDLAVPLLGKICKSKIKTPLVVLKEPRSVISETFRSLKTNISFVIPKDKQLTMAITSTLSGEGKTFTAINLASIYSLNQKSTILVSCDMFKPNTLKDFELKSKIGLSNFLSEQVNNVFDVIQPTKFPLFNIITAGETPPNPSDLLASERFGILMQELKKNYDVIILDTPPVGLISQSYELLKHVDLTLYVLRYNFSKKEFINDVNEIKMKKGVKNVFAVLNDVAAKELTYKGLNYGYYEESRDKKSKIKGVFGRNKAAL